MRALRGADGAPTRKRIVFADARQKWPTVDDEKVLLSEALSKQFSGYRVGGNLLHQKNVYERNNFDRDNFVCAA